jgi:hypothetical protein
MLKRFRFFFLIKFRPAFNREKERFVNDANSEEMLLSLCFTIVRAI